MKILLIGDVHGKLKYYFHLLGTHEHDLSIQVGDMGFLPQHQEWIKKSNEKDYLVQGNHDHYPSIHPRILQWGKITNEIFAIGGAKSIDSHYRTEGVDWFPEEEMSYKDGYAVLDTYEATKPTLLGKHRPEIDGSTVFEYNPLTGEFKKAEYRTPDTYVIGQEEKKEIDVKPNHYYIESLNEKNALKKLKQGKIIFKS